MTRETSRSSALHVHARVHVRCWLLLGTFSFFFNYCAYFFLSGYSRATLGVFRKTTRGIRNRTGPLVTRRPRRPRPTDSSSRSGSRGVRARPGEAGAARRRGAEPDQWAAAERCASARRLALELGCRGLHYKIQKKEFSLLCRLFKMGLVVWWAPNYASSGLTLCVNEVPAALRCLHPAGVRGAIMSSSIHWSFYFPPLMLLCFRPSRKFERYAT